MPERRFATREWEALEISSSAALNKNLSSDIAIGSKKTPLTFR